MAYIYIPSSRLTSTSVEMRLSGLDSSYDNAIRSVFWRVYRGTTIVKSTSQYLSNRISTGEYVKFTGLNPDTEYRAYARITNINGGAYPDVILEEYFTTENEIIQDLVPPTFSIYMITETSAKITFNMPTGANVCGLYMDTTTPTLADWVNDYSSSPITLSDLTPGTTYYVKMDSYNTNTQADSPLSSTQTFTTDSAALATPSFYTPSTTSDFVSISVVANIYTNIDDYYFEIWNYSLSSRIGYQDSSSRYATFTGLSSGTPYRLRLKVQKSGVADSDWTSWYTVYTAVAAGWNWWSNVGQGQPFMITRDEWLAFQNKINEIRVGNGLSNYSFTTSTTYVYSGKDFTATLMNQAINAINDMLAIGSKMATVSSGQSISNAFMIGIRDKLNSCI